MKPLIYDFDFPKQTKVSSSKGASRSPKIRYRIVDAFNTNYTSNVIL